MGGLDLYVFNPHRFRHIESCSGSGEVDELVLCW
jgi:hypothetical protein